VTQVVDVKCPGSGEGGSFRLSNLKHLRTGDALKFVVASPEDIDWLESFLEEQEIPSGVELFVSPVPGQMDPPLLAERILQSPHPLRLGLQLHKILWGDDIQGR
jgi:7-carboxy-7-deazaguanine synthase